MIKDEFICYKVYWFLENSKLIECRKFYDKSEALEWYESVPEERRYEIEKITEITEIIA